jgi:hypothetical protein
MYRLALLAVAGLGLGVFAVPAHASSIEHETLEAHIPFAFQLPDVKLPPGDYQIQQASDLDPNLLEIRSRDARHVAFFWAEDSTARRGVARPSLVFDRFGKDRFLRAVWADDGEGDTLRPSPAELADARRAAGLPRQDRTQSPALKK